MFDHLPSLTLAQPAVAEAAAILAERRRHGLRGPLLPQPCRPRTLDDALAIQAAVAGLMGDAIAGWKCGTPGPDKLVISPIYAGTVHHGDAACPVWAQQGSQVRIEPELAFVLGHDLPARAQPWLAADVDAAIARTHLALELIDSRYDGSDTPGFADKLADGLVNQGLYIGPEVDGERARQTAGMAIQWAVDGQPADNREGRHPDPLPRLPLYWLADFLRQQGLGLRAGQTVITGSYAGTFPVPVGKPISFVFGDLGRFDVRFEPR
jgi:2-keto-4-pentenoate hydratase